MKPIPSPVNKPDPPKDDPIIPQPIELPS